jgi:predicted dehydrogenase
VAHDGSVRSAEHPDGWLPARFYDVAASAGGALIDLGAHPLYLLHEFLGMPAEVIAVHGDMTGRGVDDHAIVTLRYPDGALATAETGFVSAGPFTAIEIDGTRGNIHLCPVEGTLRVRTSPGGSWQTVTLPDHGPIPFRQWLNLLPEGASAQETLRAAVALSALAGASARSAAAGSAARV